MYMRVWAVVVVALLLGAVVWTVSAGARYQRDIVQLSSTPALQQFGFLEPVQQSAFPHFKNIPVLRTFALARERGNLLLQQYALEARLRPLYALPGVDVTAYGKSIDALQGAKQEMLSLYPDASITPAVREGFFPTAFLQQLHMLETLRRSFVSSPDAARAEAYHVQLLRTIDAHISAVKALTTVFQNNQASSRGNAILRSVGGYTSLEHIMRVLEAYQTAGSLARGEELTRWRCYTGSIKDCSSVSLPTVGGTEILSASTSSVPTGIGTKYVFMDALRKEGPYKGHNGSTTIAVLPQSACVPWYAPAYYYLWWRDDMHGGPPTFRPDLLNDILFYDFQAPQQEEPHYAQTIESRGGARYFFQSTSQSYLCLDVMTDFTALERMLLVRRAVGGGMFDMTYTGSSTRLKNDVDMLSVARNSVSASTTLRETDTSNLMTALRTLFDDAGTADMTTWLGAARTSDLIDLMIAYVYGTSGDDELNMAVVGNSSAVKDITAAGDPTSLYALLLIRSAEPLLLGGTNPSIVPSAPAFTEAPARAFPPALMTYDQYAASHDPATLLNDLIQNMSVERAWGEEVRGRSATTSR